MEIAISTAQLIAGKTVSRNPDGTLTAIRQLFGIVPDSLEDSLAAKAAKAVVGAARASSSLDAFMDAQEAATRRFQCVSVPAGTVLAAREPITVGDTVYNAVHAGSFYAVVDGRVAVKYSTREEQNAAKAAAFKAGK
jgi:hypothetical protein